MRSLTPYLVHNITTEYAKIEDHIPITVRDNGFGIASIHLRNEHRVLDASKISISLNTGSLPVNVTHSVCLTNKPGMPASADFSSATSINSSEYVKSGGVLYLWVAINDARKNVTSSSNVYNIGLTIDHIAAPIDTNTAAWYTLEEGSNVSTTQDITKTRSGSISGGLTGLGFFDCSFQNNIFSNINWSGQNKQAPLIIRFKRNLLSSKQTIFECGFIGGGTANMKISFDADNTLIAEIIGGTLAGTFISSEVFTDTDSDHVLVYYHDTDNVYSNHFYIDGHAVNMVPQSTYTAVSNVYSQSVVAAGSAASGNSPLQGYLYDLILYESTPAISDILKTGRILKYGF